MVKPAFFDSKGMKKGQWSEDEDNKLRDYVLRYGHWNWRLLPKYVGLARCGKSCRLRWVNYLKPGVKKGNFTKEEEELIVKLQGELGNKWSAIATKFPGRTDSEIKNFWYRRIDKRHNKRNPKAKAKAHTNNIQETFISNISSIQSENHQNSTNSIINDTHSGSGSLMHESQQPDFWADSLSFPEDITAYTTFENEYFPPLPGGEVFPDDLSTSGSDLFSNVFDWIASVDDQSMSSVSSSFPEPVQEDISSEPFSWNALIDTALSEDICFDPMFQYSDYIGSERYDENVENLWGFN